MRKAFGLVLLILAATLWPMTEPAGAYPISPNPLWSLTDEAELIVVATVDQVEVYEPLNEDEWNSALARLQVQRTLKGEDRSRVEVHYPSMMICPAPPRYDEGETVVAFLTRDADASSWATVSLSYGTLYAEGQELTDLETMILHAVDLQSRGLSTRKLKRAKLDWAVEAAALPGTRWHGLYELYPEGDPIRSSYDQSRRKARNDQLSDPQRALLAQAFIKHPTADYTTVMMLAVLRGFEDPRIDRLALGMVEAALEIEKPYWLFGLVHEVLLSHGDEDPQARFANISEYPSKITPEDLRLLWSVAKAELGIDDIPPIDLDQPTYLPVGGRTPS